MKDAEIVELYWCNYYCDPIKEVAAYCGMKEAKAKSMLFRTRKRLKGFLKKEGFTL